MLKKYCLILIIFLCINSVNAQEKPHGYYLKPNNITGAATDYGIPAESEAVADSYRTFTRDSTDKKFFIVKDFYLDGKIKLIGQAKNENPEVTFEGSCIGYYKNGKRKFIENFKNGIMYDVVKYFPNGKLYIAGTYDDSIRTVRITDCQDSAGATLAENGKGKWIKYNDEFTGIKGSGQILNGLPEGKWGGRVNDSVTYECDYSNGKVVSGVSREKSGKEHIFKEELTNASFMGGLDQLYRSFERTMRYPPAARESNVQGKVFVTFVVELDGTISGYRILRGIGSGCDEECVRVISLTSGKWKPGILFGVPVRQSYTVPLSFTLAEQ